MADRPCWTSDEGGNLVTSGTEVGSGTLAYSCAYNDFALVKVGAAVADVKPSVPFWAVPPGSRPTGPDSATTLPTVAGRTRSTPPPPGVPGVSGSAFLSADGTAIGSLSTLGLAPLPASNNIGDLSRELAFAQQHSGISGLKLALGTEPFSPLLCAGSGTCDKGRISAPRAGDPPSSFSAR